MSRVHDATKVARAGVETDVAHGAVMPPIYLSANYAFVGFGKKGRYDYARTANPTRDLLADAINDLEGGAGAVITSSGMSAITLVLQLLKPGELVIAPHDCYGGTFRLLNALAKKQHFEVLFVDQHDPLCLCPALAKCPRIVWIETPSNPLLRITDVQRVSALAHEVGATVVVDNTFLSPALQKPLSLGADLVVHSTTKYLNGHSDVIGGAVVAKDASLCQELAWWANALGLTGAPFDSWLTLRGLRTLHVRMREHEQNARAIAELLVGHPAVTAVHWPGLPTHGGHAIAARQQQGFGGMLSFELRGDVERFLDGLACFSLAESLGGVESLIAHPATMTHAAMDPDARRRAGIGDQLLRISAGIEAKDDLLADLQTALQRCETGSRSAVC